MRAGCRRHAPVSLLHPLINGNVSHTVKISVYPRIICGEFSILQRNRFRIRLYR